MALGPSRQECCRYKPDCYIRKSHELGVKSHELGVKAHERGVKSHELGVKSHERYFWCEHQLIVSYTLLALFSFFIREAMVEETWAFIRISFPMGRGKSIRYYFLPYARHSIHILLVDKTPQLCGFFTGC